MESKTAKSRGAARQKPERLHRMRLRNGAHLQVIENHSVPVVAMCAAVMGGMSIVLYGFIGLNGVKVLIDNRVDFSQTRNMLIASTILVLGLGGAVIDFGKFSIYGMALAAIVGILLNAILPKEKEEKRKEASKAK